MKRLLLIRHAPTDWNAAGRIQGRVDVPLSSRGRTTAASLSVPTEFVAAMIVCSPLQRALETARLMGLSPVRHEPGLIEMDWGAWEGRTLLSLRTELGENMACNEARGLDFRPEGGESPREVQARLRSWLAPLARDSAPLVAVTHKGVIRAMLAMAIGWDMRESPRVRLRWDRGHEFGLGADGTLRLTRPNLLLEEP